MQLFLFEAGGEQLDVAPSTVDALLVFDGELDDQSLALVVEVIKAGRRGVEASILAGLKSCRSTLKVGTFNIKSPPQPPPP